MENTTLTTIDLDIQSESELELTIAHELFHQWFGDLVTCKTWDHVWIQEGWATYAEGLWREHTEGEGRVPSAGISMASGTQSTESGNETVSHKSVVEADDTFEGAEDPYTRGAFVLHLLRTRIGDEAFFRGTTAFLKKHGFSNVETIDLRRAYEEASGDSLEEFFDQWVLRPGLPNLSVAMQWVDADKSLVVNVKQTQTINEHRPAYSMEVPIRVGEKVYLATGEGERAGL